MTPAVSAIVELFERIGSRPYDEEIAQRAHAEQTAAAAVAAGAPDHLVAAALLHDIGHLAAMDDGHGEPGADAADERHEARGARILATAFPPRVTRPIALHVAAKRYLVASEEAYGSALSGGSAASLLRQGGPMDAAACQRFEATPGSRDAVRLRRWDDAAKDPRALVDDLSRYMDLLESLVIEPTARITW